MADGVKIMSTADLTAVCSPIGTTGPTIMMIRAILQQHRILFSNCFPILLLPVELREIIYHELDPTSLKNIGQSCLLIRRETEFLRFSTFEYHFDWERHFFRPYCMGYMTMRHDLSYEWPYDHHRIKDAPMDLEIARAVRHLRISLASDYTNENHWRSSCKLESKHRLNAAWVLALFPNVETISNKTIAVKWSSISDHGCLDLSHFVTVENTKAAPCVTIPVPSIPKNMQLIKKYFLGARELWNFSHSLQRGALSMVSSCSTFDLAARCCSLKHKKLVAIMKEEPTNVKLRGDVQAFCEVLASHSHRWPFKLYEDSQLPDADGILRAITEFSFYPCPSQHTE